MRNKKMLFATVVAAMLSLTARAEAEGHGPLVQVVVDAVPVDMRTIPDITAFLVSEFPAKSAQLRELQEGYCKRVVASFATIRPSAVGTVGAETLKCITSLATAIAAQRVGAAEVASRIAQAKSLEARMRGLQAANATCADALRGCGTRLRKLEDDVAGLKQAATLAAVPVPSVAAADSPPGKMTQSLGGSGELVFQGDAAQVAPLFAGAAAITCAHGFDALVKDPNVILTSIGGGRYRVAFKDGGFTCVTSERVTDLIPIMPTDTIEPFSLNPPAGRLPGAPPLPPPAPPPAPGWCKGDAFCRGMVVVNIASAIAGIAGAGLSVARGDRDLTVASLSLGAALGAGLGVVGFANDSDVLAWFGTIGGGALNTWAAARGAFVLPGRVR